MAKKKTNDARIDFVRQSLYSLNFCAVRAKDYLREWFVPAFNQWYVQNGFSKPFSAFFDYGIQLVHPGATFAELPDPENTQTERFHRYRRHLRSLQEEPLMRRARRI